MDACRRLSVNDLAVPGSPSTTVTVVIVVAISFSEKKSVSSRRQSRPSRKQSCSNQRPQKFIACEYTDLCESVSCRSSHTAMHADPFSVSLSSVISPSHTAR